MALAAALDAERCEIYSDVDGVYSADPSLVPEACHLPEISYPVMQEMSTAGAKVLNAHAVQFAKEKQIAIYARSTFAPGKETVVRKMPPEAVTGVQAVVSEQRIARIRFTGRRALRDFQQAVVGLEKEQVQIKEVSVSHVDDDPDRSRAAFVVSLQSVYAWETIQSSLEEGIGRGIAFDTDLTALSLIGEGLNRTNRILLATLDLLEQHRIPVTGITTTSFRISLLTPRDCSEEAVRLCHERWIEGPVAC